MIIVLIVTILGTAIGTIAAADVQAWCSKLSQYLLSQAVEKLPEPMRERYREEWSGHLLDSPGSISKMLAAFGFIITVKKLATEKRRANFVSQLKLINRGVKLGLEMSRTEISVRQIMRDINKQKKRISYFDLMNPTISNVASELNGLEEKCLESLQRLAMNRQQLSGFFKRQISNL